MPDIIITPSTGKLEFIDDSSQIQRRHSFSMDDDDGIKIDAPFRASSVRAPLNVINVTVNNSNVNYPFVLASGSAETGIKTLMMDGAGGTYNPFTNTATIDISGNSATTTLASNSSQLNGQSDSYYTNITARLGYTPVNKAGDTVSGNLTVNGNFSVNGSFTAFSASNIYLSSSVLTVEDNILTLNAFSPYLRYAGIEMYDSGSGTLSQLLWDGDGDYFFLTGSSVNGKIITGPDGQTNLSSNYVPKATAGYKLGNSLIYDNGTNIGIGITTPVYKTEIYSGVKTSAFTGLSISNFNNYDGTANSLVKSQLRFAILENPISTYDASQRTFAILESGNEANNSSSDGFFAISTRLNGTVAEKFRITSAGNVGIGTTNPVSILDVVGLNGSFPATSSTTQSTGSLVRLRNGNSNLVLDIGGNGGNGNWLQSTNRSDLSVNYPLLLNPNGGNVGIGTTTPSRKLHVYSSGLSDNTVNPLLLIDGKFTAAGVDSNDIVGIAFRVENSAGGSQTTTCIGSSYQGAGNALLLQPVSGNVGVGTINPSFKLDVGAAGNDVVSVRLTPGYERVRYYGFDLLGYNDGNLWMIGNNPTNTLVLGKTWDWDNQIGIAYTPGTVGNSGGILQIGQISKNNANYTHGITRLYTNGLERITIIANGNVGISTTLPTTPLHVVGVISGSSFSGAGTGLTGTAASLTAGTATIANGVSTGAVKSGGLEENSVITSKIADGNVTNVKLASSSVTIGSSAVSLGSTLTTIAGLTSVTSTTFVGALTGTGSWATNAVTALNGGVTSIVAGTSISISGGTGAVTVNNSSPNATHTGDVTGATTLTIANDAVTTVKILNANVTNAKLANSSVTIGSTAISLGATATTIAGLTSVTSTTFVGALTGTATTASYANALNAANTYTVSQLVTTGKLEAGGNVIAGGQFSGAGTGLTGTASGLSIGGSAATATSASFATTAATATSANSATIATSVNGTNGQLLTKDVRTIAPNNIANGYFQFGFTSWTNNNNSPYADYLHLRSYTDSSGGNDNLVMFRKDAIGMRIWQQTFGSATNYSSYKDVCWTDGTNASGTWAITSSWATNALNVNNATLTVAAGTGISLSATPTFTANASVDKTITITNGGVTSAVAGIGVGVSGATGAVTFSIGQAVGTGNSPTFAAVTTSTDGANHIMAGTTNAEGIRMTPASSTTYPVFLRSINPGVGEASPWIYKEQATDWGIWHNNPVNSIDFTKQGSVGISTNVGGSSTNAVTVRVEMATGFVQTIAGYRNSAGTTILDNNGNITGNAATATILQTARNIGGVSFNGSADINLPGVNTAGNQNTSGNAATATTATNANAVSFTEVELNAPVTVSGTWSSGNGSEWGEPKFGTSFNQFRYTDGNGPYVEYNIPANHHACFISQLQWDTGGYADCHGVQSDGDLVFLRRINTRQLVENSNHGNTIQHDGATVSFVGSGLQAFTKIRITNRSGRLHMTGIAFTRQIDDGYEGTGMVHPAQISHQGSGSGLDADLLDGYNSATANTANTIVLRDASGNFSAGTITATLSGTATTANALNTSNSYTGVNFTATGFLQSNSGNIKSDTSFALLTTTNGAQSVSVRGILLGTSYDTTPGANEIRTTNNTSLYLNARGTGDIQFQTADSLKMMLLNNGNVGIGTSSPSSRVHIYENANRVTYIAQNNNHIARFEAYGTATAIDTTASNGIFFRINGGDIVKFAADGNVGIGTNTVTAKVESYFSSNAVTINYLATNLNNNSPIPVYGFDVTNGSGETRSIKAGIGYERHLTNGRGTLHFYNDSTNDTQSLSGNRTSAGDIKMSIDNDGNVGIGTPTPTYKLHVVGKGLVVQSITGTPRWDNNSFELRSTGGNGVALEFHREGSTSATIASMAGEISLYTDSGTERMRISPTSGNVGIGTSNPGRKLDVEGIVRTRGASGTGGFEISAASSGTAKWRIEWDSASDSLDFNWVG